MVLEKEMATHSSILAWRTPWMEEPGGLQSTGSQRVGHDWATSLLAHGRSSRDNRKRRALKRKLENNFLWEENLLKHYSWTSETKHVLKCEWYKNVRESGYLLLIISKILLKYSPAMLFRFWNMVCWGAEGDWSESVRFSESWFAVVFINSIAAWRTLNCRATAISKNRKY